MKISSCVIIRTIDSPPIIKVAQEVESFLIKQHIQVFHYFDPYHSTEDLNLPDEKIDLAIVVGGDGTALKATRICAARNIPILPINQGTFGFINEIPFDEWQSAFHNLQHGRSKIGEYHLLEISVSGKSWLAFNDVTFCSAGYGTISASVTRQKELITRYRADGIIITTPTGSTAHSLSVGGPIISPGLDVLMINPIAPFSLSNRPIILSIADKLSINIEQSRYNCCLVLDGRVVLGLMEGCTVTIKDSTLRAKVVHSDNISYFGILRNKLGWAGEFRA